MRLRLNQTRRVASRLAALICLHYPAARKSIRFLRRRSINLGVLSSCIQPGSVGLQLITARGYGVRFVIPPANANRAQNQRAEGAVSPVGPEGPVSFVWLSCMQSAASCSGFRLPASGFQLPASSYSPSERPAPSHCHLQRPPRLRGSLGPQALAERRPSDSIPCAHNAAVEAMDADTPRGSHRHDDARSCSATASSPTWC